MTFLGTWAEIRETTFLACLLAYGPRPNVQKGEDFDAGCDLLFTWDHEVIEYLLEHPMSDQMGWSQGRHGVLRAYLAWLEESNVNNGTNEGGTSTLAGAGAVVR